MAQLLLGAYARVAGEHLVDLLPAGGGLVVDVVAAEIVAAAPFLYAAELHLELEHHRARLAEVRELYAAAFGKLHVFGELHEGLHRVDLVKAEVLAAVVHGDDELGVYGVGQLARGLGVDGVEAADGDEQGVHMADGLNLARGQHVAHVAEVRHARAAAGNYADEVLAALLAAARRRGSSRASRRCSPSAGR